MKNNLLDKNKAEKLLLWAEKSNPGKWIQHSYHVAKSAEIIANKCSLDNNFAYILGLLHDIGRYEGITNLRHVYAGYNLMNEKGYYDIAKICLTHSFPFQNIESYQGDIDCDKNEVNYLKNELEKTLYNDYDKLIQLCDALCLAEGVTIIECRIVDVVNRYGFNKYTLNKWNSIFENKKYFDKKCNMNIYELFYEDIIKNILRI
ncbi:phosphohydrolase [Spirochaetia bacterium]|nr:phosphohydrolase [Spirochaetia bacterium]GHU30871.1 phosphohydrolase [Spirochaetia bacterium]